MWVIASSRARGTGQDDRRALYEHGDGVVVDPTGAPTIAMMAWAPDKVVVAMSGGVDSSVAAGLLVEQGYEVMGLFMRVGATEPAGACAPGHAPAVRTHQGCCGASDAADARFVAGMFGIPFYALNFEGDFDRIIDYFADEYVRGRTPNPCIACNDQLKFGKIVEYADAVGAKYIATGHYARIATRDGRRVLMRGRDATKDQSYVLFGLDRSILERVMFPVGELTKTEVRQAATRLELPNRDKPDSVEICFVPDRDYARVVRERRSQSFVEGDVVDVSGKVIGRHKGLGHYTIGQRRGLGIAAGHPLYVTALDVERNIVTLGAAEHLLCKAVFADRATFLVDVSGEVVDVSDRAGDAPDGTGEAPGGATDAPDRIVDGPEGALDSAPPAREHPSDTGHGAAPSRRAFRAEVKIRYLHQAAPAAVHLLHGDTVRVVFDEPQRAVTPGQAIVFYDGDVVLGGAWIDRAETFASVPG